MLQPSESHNPSVLILGLIAGVISFFAQTGCSNLAQQSPASHAATTKQQTQTTYSFNDALKTGAKGPEMVVVPKGSFIMGDQQGNGKSNELTHEVNINQAYAIGKFEVTVGQFREFVEDTGHVTSAEKGQGCYTFGKALTWNWIQRANWSQPNFEQTDSHPVVCVSWHDAVAYTNWLSTQTGQQYRLPTEAEWEYVARAGTNTNFWWGNENDKCDNANCCLGQNWVEKQTRAVGSYQANTFGVHDTVGNVWEWTASNYIEQFSGDKDRVADLTENDTMKTMRGGSWYSFPSDTRSSKRAKNWPQERLSTLGFRVVRAVTPDLVNVALGQQ